jgi:hypothetical protein
VTRIAEKEQRESEWQRGPDLLEKGAGLFTLLHISDLHRSHDEPIDNDSLIAALLADSDRYLGETPIVPPPGAIVVSGDLVQGAAIGASGWQSLVRDQYRVAGEFLNHLSKRFLGGDRSKLIVVPGNHDVSWNTALAAMERVPEHGWPKDLRRALMEPDSTYRWSWNERALYRVRDMELYAARMQFYWDFIESFYSGVTLPLPVDRHRGFQLFELHDRRVVVAAFDSIERNDCFSYAGAIPRGAAARCCLHLRDNPHSYNLRVAVWHHSTQGPPLRDDYMEVGQVREMVGLGFQLGLHGHQHVAETTTQLIYLNEGQSMGIVSAGSLCAGARELPRGVNRQYNLVVLDDELRRARVHVREVVDGEQFSGKRNGAFIEGFSEVSWQTATDIAGRPIDVAEENNRRAVMRAEEALHAGRPQDAVALLQGIKTTFGSHARKVAIQAFQRAVKWNGLIDVIGIPESVEEAVLLVSAFVHCDLLDQAASALEAIDGLDDSTRRALSERITLKRMMRA